MNDETKDELMKRTREWLQSCVNAATRSGVPEEADLEAFILAHIDGEPERIAAARREAAEEKAEEGVRYWTDLAQAEARDAAALRTRVAELEAQLSKAEARVAELQDELAHEKGGRLDEAAIRAACERETGVWPYGRIADAIVETLRTQQVHWEAFVTAESERAEKAERFADQLCAVLGREVGNRGDNEGAVDVAEWLIRERDEAVAALRVAKRWAESGDDSIADAGEYVRSMAVVEAVLAKYPEGK